MLPRTFCRIRCLALCGIVLVSGPAVAEPLVRDGDVLAICGDSITEQKQYSVMIETYLRLCQPLKVDVVQFGWSGERAPGFLARMKTDVLPVRPTIATTLYGMNDGAYKAISDETRTTYREAMTKIVETFKAAGARVIVGSPGAVDTVSFKRPSVTPEVYNATLAALGEESKTVAESTGQHYADVHTPMLRAIVDAKAKFGEGYLVGGNDGFHPGRAGHLAMAYGFLKAMGFDGNVGTITVDLAANTAVADGGHSVRGVENNIVTIESTRYPFCFNGRLEDHNETAGVATVLPFNSDLNRLTLIVKAAPGRYRVKWGETTREYTAEQLAAGVNLAADFVPSPFNAPFNAVVTKIAAKQAFETRAYKQLIHVLADSPDVFDAADRAAAAEKIARRHAQLTEEVQAAIKPVTHMITIEKVG
ncbi:MAG TPA: SGNH/GDSL hydrolase family protein [Tepidisphaeraceae bacterium]|jgi:lysophospholipase L1-like esterase